MVSERVIARMRTKGRAEMVSETVINRMSQLLSLQERPRFKQASPKFEPRRWSGRTHQCREEKAIVEGFRGVVEG